MCKSQVGVSFGATTASIGLSMSRRCTYLAKEEFDLQITRAAIVAQMMARGQTAHGASGVETFVPARPFVEELRRRGLKVTEGVEKR